MYLSHDALLMIGLCLCRLFDVVTILFSFIFIMIVWCFSGIVV